jgi:uncharacterized protein YdaU (DUF1376 family)
MPWYPGDFERDTGHLSPEEVGAYVRLINHYMSRGELPNDDQRLASIVRIDVSKWMSIRAAIAPFFLHQMGEQWRHKRLDSELARADEISLIRARAGARALKSNAKSQAAIARQLHKLKLTQPQPHISPSLNVSGELRRWNSRKDK